MNAERAKKAGFIRVFRENPRQNGFSLLAKLVKAL
jgi:hypothetical protein